jgi:LPXTG-motif cell wall-anchored protein
MTISGSDHPSRHHRSTGRRRMSVLVLCALAPLLAVLAASPAAACETPDVTVVATAPSATDPTCSADGALVIPTVTGVTYKSTPRGTGPNTYSIKAEAKEGYQLSGTHSWTITVKPRLTGEQCLTKVEPIAPILQVSTCDGPSSTVPDGSIAIPEQQGVDFYVDDAKILYSSIPIAQGTARTVTAVAQDGYTLTGTTSWTFSNPSLSCLVPVTPVDPTVVASTTCEVEGTFTIPETTGIRYLLDGTPIAAGTYPGPKTGTLTAAALDGYVLSTSTTVRTLSDPGWSFALNLAAATVCEPDAPVVVIPVAPTSDPSQTCEVEGTYTIASTTGIEYLLDGTVVAAGTYTGPKSGTITARALEGYQLSDPEWSATLSLTEATTCPASVLPQTGSTGSTAGIATGGALALLVGFALIAVASRRAAEDIS